MPVQKKTYFDQYTDYIKNNNVKPTATSASTAKTATASTMKTNPNDDVSQIKGLYGAPNNSKIAVTPGGIPINYAMELTGKEQVGTSMGNNFDMSSVKDYGNPSKTDIVDRNMRNGGNNLLVDVGSFNIGGGGFSYTPVGKIGGFAPSQAYLDAMAYTQGLLDKLNTGRTSYSDKVDAMMGKIENRDPFQYDFNTDPLFQNALASAMQSGQTAMQDTIGQASALTGGYGSSYATSAGNQAYNQMVTDAYAQLPEYYQLAMQAYDTETQNLYNQLGMYQTADDTEYGRLSNAYNMNYNQAQNMYNQEYSNFWDTNNYNLNVDEFNANQAYKAASLAQDAAQFNAKMNYQQYQDALSRADAAAAQTASAKADAQAVIDANNQTTLKGSDFQKIADEYDKYNDAEAAWRLADTYPNLTDADILKIEEIIREKENARINLSVNKDRVKQAKDNRETK